MFDVRCFSQSRKTRAKHFPDLILDLICVARALDQHDSIWCARSKLAVCFANTLIKLSGLLFHPVDPARLLHSRLRSYSIDIQHESDFRHAIADRKHIQALDHFAIQFSRRALINSRGIKETICDHTYAAFEGGVDDLAYQLAAAGLKEKELGFRSHS